MTPAANSAYMFVIVLSLSLFMIIFSVIALTATSRRTSAQYIHFAGLYNLAMASCERVLFLLPQDNDALTEQVRERLRTEGVEPRLVYIDGNLSLEGRFLQLFREEKNRAISAYLAENLGRVHAQYFFSYNLTVPTGTYAVRTYISPVAGVYRVRSTASKNGGQELIVCGQIYWPSFRHSAIVIPTAVEWRYGSPYETPLNPSEVAGLLNYLRITDFELEAEPLYDFRPRMRRLQQIDRGNCPP